VNGDEFRWDARYLRWQHPHSVSSIQVIEKPDDEVAGERPRPTVPFGFAREIPRAEIEPLLWEGD
jgi:hypothetical protein